MKYPIGIQMFEKIRSEGYVYVDKTEQVYRLANTGSYYFLSRPRRFGKSLLLSTFKAYFEGRKDLFEGLAMEKLETEWKSYPILYLDLNASKYETPEDLDARLNKTLSQWEECYGTNKAETSSPLRFEGIVQRAKEKTGKPVVILVDEYDKPMLQAVGNAELLQSYRSTLKAFYSVLKSMDDCIRFAFLTGVTKFSKVSVFSDLNNLNDISMVRKYSSICGITAAELHAYFEEGIGMLADAEGVSADEMKEKLRMQYDGYHFVPNSEGIYNPFSLLSALNNTQLGNYWFETGTPTFLVELLKRSSYDLRNLHTEEVAAGQLDSIDSMEANPIPVLFQSGYLTIKGYDAEFQLYQLDFPNKEVEWSFTQSLLPFYTPQKNGYFHVGMFVKELRNGDMEQFMRRLQVFFADANYKVAGNRELYFQNAMYVIFRLMGFFTEVERATSDGRIDVLVKTADYIYIMELKLDGSADEALRQINEKQYAVPFAMDGRKIYKIGISFSSEKRGVTDWKIQ